MTAAWKLCVKKSNIVIPAVLNVYEIQPALRCDNNVSSFSVMLIVILITVKHKLKKRVSCSLQSLQ